ncbi:MAG: 7-cyano-7-deazaguanine synthase QueC [Candidatus Omnitrophica bacterium]|nr:7-cyano-7-deazaguanine synthase QueC [Candidatus Omnitrophota bacterium]
MSRRLKAPRAVVLLSGGLDSATTLYAAKSKGYRCHCLAIDYGQRHRRELRSAKAVARLAGCPIQFLRIRLPWGGSALTDRRIPVPRGRSFSQMGQGIPVTYVPARNTIFLSYAASFAEAIGASAIFIGANARDYSGYPDCRPAYYEAFRQVIRRGTKAGAEGKPIRIETPLIGKSKAQIIRLGKRLGVPYELTWSCYLGGAKPCRVCDSCLLRAKGFQEASLAERTILSE